MYKQKNYDFIDHRNRRRAERIGRLIEWYKKETGDVHEKDVRVHLTDMLADLQHYLVLRPELNFSDLLQQSRHHFQAELKGE